MKQVTSLFAHKVLGVVETQQNKRVLLEGLGLDADAPIDPSIRVSAEDYYDFLQRCAAIDEQPYSLPLRAGAAMRCDDYGAFGLAWKSAVNLQGSFMRAQRYGLVLTNVASYTLAIQRDEAFFHLHREGERRLGMRLSNEATVASVQAICQQVATQPFQAKAIYFKHQAPDVVSEHQAYFGCELIFDADKEGLLLDTAMLAIPNQLGDESISRFFDAHLDSELSKYGVEETLAKRVHIQIAKRLSEGVPTLSDIAAEFAMSARSLQRKLAESGVVYQHMVDEARRQLAEQLLQNTQYSLADIAYMTGFSEQSAFNRAFKRWSGLTPRSYRLQLPQLN